MNYSFGMYNVVAFSSPESPLICLHVDLNLNKHMSFLKYSLYVISDSRLMNSLVTISIL